MALRMNERLITNNIQHFDPRIKSAKCYLRKLFTPESERNPQTILPSYYFNFMQSGFLPTY
jgi:hypothetical protein